MNLNSEPASHLPVTLADLRPGDRAQVLSIVKNAQAAFQTRLLEMGFMPGALVYVQHEAPISRDPIAVEIDGAMFALRRADIKYIQVKKI